MRRLLVLAALCFAVPAHAVTIDWVTVGDPGNACEWQSNSGAAPGGCFGAVDYIYRIAKYEVTNAQYAEFLNAVAATDTYDLYHTSMGTPTSPSLGGITQSGSSGSYSYSAIAGRENMPVHHVSFFNTLRFANWLHNGQLSGAQDSTTTEDGAYTITAQGIADNSITRNAEATVFLTSEDEWYKAAYFNGTSYFDYPAGSDTQTTCATPGATPNTANCNMVVGDLTGVGSYTGSASPYGTFDQGGNAQEWNEAIVYESARIVRGGGGFGETPYMFSARFRQSVNSSYSGGYGFRVAMIPEPSTALLVATGLAGLAVAGRRKQRG